MKLINIPTKVYAQHNLNQDDFGKDEEVDFSKLGFVTWSETRINDDDVEYHLSSSVEKPERWKHQLCPKCDGEGYVPNFGGVSSNMYRPCPVCEGAKTLMIPG